MKKILVLDIDGTLTNTEKEVTIDTLDAIIRIQKRGHVVVLASGRPTPGLRRLSEILELKKYGGYLLSYNGAKIINAQTEEIVYEKTLKQELIPKLYNYAIEKNIGLVTYENGGVVTGTRIDNWMLHEARINGLKIHQVDNFCEYVDYSVNKCLFTVPVDISECYEKELVNLYSDVASIYRSEAFFIEVMPHGIDKATTLDRLVKALDMKPEDVIACGDGFNDISMIKYAGVGVAMANAKEVVKETADYITLSNDEDGIVPVIEKYIL